MNSIRKAALGQAEGLSTLACILSHSGQVWMSRGYLRTKELDSETSLLHSLSHSAK